MCNGDGIGPTLNSCEIFNLKISLKTKLEVPSKTKQKKLELVLKVPFEIKNWTTLVETWWLHLGLTALHMELIELQKPLFY
jgi:hypothetical protein